MREENNVLDVSNSRMEEDRLSKLIADKFLSSRIFKRISENMHYEIFKYLNALNLVNIRGTNLGGYQLTSNNILRSRIKNYFPHLKFKCNKWQLYQGNVRRV